MPSSGARGQRARNGRHHCAQLRGAKTRASAGPPWGRRMRPLAAPVEKVALRGAFANRAPRRHRDGRVLIEAAGANAPYVVLGWLAKAFCKAPDRTLRPRGARPVGSHRGGRWRRSRPALPRPESPPRARSSNDRLATLRHETECALPAHHARS